ncbi:phospholipase D-like domain-containing protein [Rhizosaccharibacter radicis]|uniref:Phospholipase D n=1 Tax=Rhizosaccharibacter radicis TaxID=2782605 RepID=A0ABT1VVK8_9PROT|nr:phospholipase D-like domain-containing protein [Acetobacteraceae bacterium KSS12]
MRGTSVRAAIPLGAMLLVAAPAVAEGLPSGTVQIVESVPEGTMFGQNGVPRTQAVWLDMIRGAHASIDIAAFYVTDKPGHALAPVLDALIDRARAGIKVRLLLDGTFLHESESSVQRLRGVPNLSIAVLPMSRLAGGVLHAKYMVVDGKELFLGSQNFDWRALEQIHEIGVRIADERFARTLLGGFELDWRLANDPVLPAAMKTANAAPDFRPATEEDPVMLRDPAGGPVIGFPALSPPMADPNWVTAEEPALLHMIGAARRVLRIQVMTLSALKGYGAKGWWSGLDSALRDASARGVEVRIVVADWAMHEPMQSYLKSLAAMPNITVKISSVPPSPSGFIPFARVEHCKYAVADDDSVYVGTGNWEWSYFNDTVDASAFLHGAGPASTLSAIFDRDWNGPYATRMALAGHYEAPRTR